MEKSSFLAQVSGVVQGVGFRYFTYHEAVLLNITGYVRNLADSRVEVFAEGPRLKLEQFLERLYVGPRFSQVEHIEIQWGEFKGKYSKFNIETGWS